MSNGVQCSECGQMVEYLLDDGVCESCFRNSED